MSIPDPLAKALSKNSLTRFGVSAEAQLPRESTRDLDSADARASEPPSGIRKQTGGYMKPRSEKGLLTPDNCVITLIDHQPQMLFGVTNFDRQGIINNVVALAKGTRVFEIP